MGQSQKYFFKAIYYIARGLCPNFSPLGPILKEEIGNKGIKWPLLYIYTRKKSRDFPGFNSISWDFPRFPIPSQDSWYFLCLPGIFHTFPCYPRISCALSRFPMPCRDFPCLSGISHAFPGFPMLSWDLPCFPRILEELGAVHK